MIELRHPLLHWLGLIRVFNCLCLLGPGESSTGFHAATIAKSCPNCLI